MLTIITIGGFCSCSKVTLEEDKTGKLCVTTIDNLEKGGDDDDDPIIQGLVLDNEESPVSNATVHLYKAGTTTILDTDVTDSNGEFDFVVTAGDYYFKVIPQVQNPVTTNPITVTADVQVTIYV